MKLIIGKPDDSEIVLAEQVGGVWQPNPNLSAELATFLKGEPVPEICTGR